MCWRFYATKNETLESKIAEEDIPIFKVCLIVDSNTVKSYYKYFIYFLNGKYVLGKNLVSEENDSYANLIYEINEGFHSYSEDCTVSITYRTILIEFPENRVFPDIYCASKIHKVAVVRGYIPKGATYYLNNAGDYVSDKIVLTEIDNNYVLEDVLA